MAENEIILLPSFSCQFDARLLKGGDLNAGAIEVDPLDRVQGGVCEQGIQVAAIGCLVALERGDDESLIIAVELDSMCDQQGAPISEFDTPHTVRLATEMMNQSFVVKQAGQVSAPIVKK